MEPRKILFIVNPKAGKQLSQSIIELIRTEFPQNIYYQIAVWKDKEHFEEILGAIGTGGYTDVVAVGGDGTVNQVAKSILNTKVRLGILPAGSGNGLARSLGISMDVRESIRQIVEGNSATIDSGTVNGIPFFCTSGVGFDAHIGNLFATSLKRGLQSYVKITARELFRYRAKEYTIRINGGEIRRKAFLITVANAGQYGNDFYIAPQASMQDGKFHIAVLKPFNVVKVFGLLQRILARKAYLSSSIETFTASKVVIERPAEDFIHFDGEPSKTTKEVVFEMHPASLNAIVGKTFKAA